MPNFIADDPCIQGAAGSRFPLDEQCFRNQNPFSTSFTWHESGLVLFSFSIDGAPCLHQ